MDHSDAPTPGKSPAFQFYARDFATGTAALSAEEVGVYIRLLCQQWDKGTLPSEIDRLARIAGIPIVRMRRLWPDLSLYFVADPQTPGGLINTRLERERAKQAEFRRRQSDKGKASGASRTKREPDANRGSTPVQPNPQPEGQPEPNSAICSLQSADFSQKNKSAASVFGFPERARATSTETTLAIRAGDFVDRYKALHVRLRKGAQYVGPRDVTADFKEAEFLAGIYDDARLDKLAFVWLNTDHDFAQNGSRTLAKMRSMASWCEEKLIEWEQKNGPLEVAS